MTSSEIPSKGCTVGNAVEHYNVRLRSAKSSWNTFESLQVRYTGVYHFTAKLMRAPHYVDRAPLFYFILLFNNSPAIYPISIITVVAQDLERRNVTQAGGVGIDRF